MTIKEVINELMKAENKDVELKVSSVFHDFSVCNVELFNCEENESVENPVVIAIDL